MLQQVGAGSKTMEKRRSSDTGKMAKESLSEDTARGREAVAGPFHTMNRRGNVVVLDGDKSYAQNEETNKKTRINYEQG